MDNIYDIQLLLFSLLSLALYCTHCCLSWLLLISLIGPPLILLFSINFHSSLFFFSHLFSYLLFLSLSLAIHTSPFSSFPLLVLTFHFFTLFFCCLIKMHNMNYWYFWPKQFVCSCFFNHNHQLKWRMMTRHLKALFPQQDFVCG